jgi:polysaccharide biosynthesis protein PslG
MGRRGLRQAVVVGVAAIIIAYLVYLVATSAARAHTTSLASTTVPATSVTTSPGPPRSLPLKDLGIDPGSLNASQLAELLNLAQAAGAQVINTSVNWAAFEPTGPAPSNEWGGFDRFVAAVHSRHFKLRIQLIGFPDWARDPGQPSEKAAPWLPPIAPDELTRWDGFVGRFARHYRGSVDYFEVWNEPNISEFWYPNPHPAQYALLLESSYVTLKQADPTVPVVFGGLSRNDIGFLQQVYDALNSQFPGTAVPDHHFFDILAVNPYTGSRSPAVVSPSHVYPTEFGLMDENFLGFTQLHAVMVQQGEPYKGIYITEYGFTTVTYSAYFTAVSDTTRASYLRTAWSLASAQPYVVGFSWFCFYPTVFDPAGFAILQGTPGNWTKTETYYAFASVGT